MPSSTAQVSVHSASLPTLVISIFLATGLDVVVSHIRCEVVSHIISLIAWAVQHFPCVIFIVMFVVSLGNFYLELYLSLTWGLVILFIPDVLTHCVYG